MMGRSLAGRSLGGRLLTGRGIDARPIGGGFAPKAFDISDLFRGGEDGIWLRPFDLSTLFQDSAGTIPVTGTGEPVGLIRDKSGNSHHFSQGTDPARPLLNITAGKYALASDGTDDEMRCSAIAGLTSTGKNWTMIAAHYAFTDGGDASRAGVVTIGATAGTRLNCDISLISRSTANDVSFSISGVVDLPASGQLNGDQVIVQTTRKSGLVYDLRFNGVAKTGTTDVSDLNADGVVLIHRRAAANFGKNLLYGLVIVARALTDAEIINTERYLAQDSGAAL